MAEASNVQHYDLEEALDGITPLSREELLQALKAAGWNQIQINVQHVMQASPNDDLLWAEEHPELEVGDVLANVEAWHFGLFIRKVCTTYWTHDSNPPFSFDKFFAVVAEDFQLKL